MKELIKTRNELQSAGRWDIDFHLPAEGVKKFPTKLLMRADKVANVVRDKRDPVKTPELGFLYIDISSVDVSVGVISTPQELEGSEAPSRARKVVRAFDLIISTCRPTRGAIAVVPPHLHNQIASTGFSILRPHPEVNPFYLHYALRLPSTLEQFRKWSTGSSYPAILDDDVAKTLLPIPDGKTQDSIAATIVSAFAKRGRAIHAADLEWQETVNGIYAGLTGQKPDPAPTAPANYETPHTIEAIRAAIHALPPLDTDNGDGDLQFHLEELAVA